MMHHPTSQQAIRFGAIGVVGFFVDGGILTLLNSAFGIDLLRSRLVSFGVAVTATWYLNRQHTFSDRKSKRGAHEWMRYVIVNGLGALLNMAIFFFLIYKVDALAAIPLVPLGIAAGFALVFNFLMSKHLAFRVT